MNKNIKAVICDLDNTLYDWVSYFVQSFYAMVDELERLTSIDRETLLDNFRRVHQRHGNSEHPFALLELPCLLEKYPNLSNRELAAKLNPAMYAFNKTRKATLQCYPDVEESLRTLVDKGVRLIAHTDSDLHAVVDRLKRLNIVDYFDAVYCREPGETRHPQGKSLLDWSPDFPIGKIASLPRDCKKPAPQVVTRICEEQGVDINYVAYIGDSISKDIYMAQQAGVYAIWAKYGVIHSKELYDRLVRVSHWTKDDVALEKQLSLSARDIQPNITLERGFSELLDII